MAVNVYALISIQWNRQNRIKNENTAKRNFPDGRWNIISWAVILCIGFCYNEKRSTAFATVHDSRTAIDSMGNIFVCIFYFQTILNIRNHLLSCFLFWSSKSRDSAPLSIFVNLRLLTIFRRMSYSDKFRSASTYNLSCELQEEPTLAVGATTTKSSIKSVALPLSNLSSYISLVCSN